MSPRRRIIINVAVTYGRSLYALVLGLFTARWALQALGRIDYGLMGLVGGLSGFVSFINSLMASAVGRFYAVNIGGAKSCGDRGLEECRRWFNTALAIHTLLPVLLVVIGYPIGACMIKNYLTIPADRLVDCVLIWRLTCLSCFVSMVNVPFSAMYTAKQEIAELTVYGFITVTLNAIFIYHMVSVPGNWLVKFMSWTCAVNAMPQLIIAVNAFRKFPECRVIRIYLWDFERIREVCKYAYARFVANFSGMLSSQAKAILVNKYMGPDHNASMAIATSLSGHAMTLSASMSGALWPAIASKAGEGDSIGVKSLSFMACRMGSVLILIFALPLMMEIDEVLELWLHDPPPFAAEISCAIIVSTILQKLTDGYWMTILGYGKGVVYYSHRSCLAGVVLICIAWMLFAFGFGMWSIAIAIVLEGGTLLVVRLYTGQKLVGYSVRCWFVSVFIPVCAATVIAIGFAAVPHFLMPQSFARILVTSFISELVFLPLAWYFVFNDSEKAFVLSRLRSFAKKVKKA